MDHLRVFFAHAGYWLSIRTDSRKNTATALFGLNIDNLVKLSSARPYSIMTVTIAYIVYVGVNVALYNDQSS